MTQYNTSLPQDQNQMRTSAVPKGQEASYEWTTPTHITGSAVGYDPADNMFQVKSNQKKWKVDFAGSALDPAFWDVTLGTGQTTTVSAGVLTIASGTTINSETILLSKETFTIPVRVMIAMNMSQKIANTDVWLELVSVDPATGLVDSAANINTAAWKVSGTDSTTNDFAQYFVQAKGITQTGSGNVDTNVPHQAAWGMFEIEPFADECWFHARVMDSASGRTSSYVRHQNIPNPNKIYKIRIRVKNAATAPASSTNVQFQFVNANDYAELTAEITAGRGNISSGQAMAVQTTNTGYQNVYQQTGNDSLPWSMSPYPGLTQGRWDYARSMTNLEYSANLRSGVAPVAGTDIPTWQYMRYAPVTTGAGTCTATDTRGTNRYIYILYSITSFWRYDVLTDSYQQLASPNALGGSGTWGAGSVMRFDASKNQIWLVNGYTTTAGFGVYDVATDVWTAKTVPTGAWGTEAQLVHPDTTVNAGAASDDFLYLFGNNATVVKRYSISGNAWTTLTAPPGTLGTGTMAFWAHQKDVNLIYVFRGGATSTVYTYNISANTWATVTIRPTIETITTGSCGTWMGDKNMWVYQLNGTHRLYALNMTTMEVEPFGNIPYVAGTNVAGDKLTDIQTTDGSRFLYYFRQTGQELFRTKVFHV